jgi:hypothetical protein
MIKLSKFTPSKEKQPKHFLFSPDVPLFWNGYYAIFKPCGKEKLWTKKWFATKNGKTFKKAFLTMDVNQAHIHWNDWLNGKNPLKELDYLKY